MSSRVPVCCRLKSAQKKDDAAMRYTDTPEVLKQAEELEQLPRWYLALMLARVLNRKALPAHRNGRGNGGEGNPSRQERETVVIKTDGGGEVVHLRGLFSADKIC